MAEEHPISGRFLFNINFVFVASLVANTVGFLSAIVVARALGPEGRGVLALYQAAVNIALALLNLGVGASLFYFLARDEMSERQASEAGLSISAFAALVTALGVAVTALLFSGRIAEKHLPYALAVVAVTALIQLRVISALLRARGRFGAMNAVDVATPALLLAGFGGTALLWGLTVQGAVWIWSLVFLAPLAMGYAFAGRKAWPRALASRALVLRVVRFGAQNQLTGLVQLLNYRIDTFLILVLVNTTGVGLYTVATSQTEGLWILADSVVIVLLTNITAGDEANAVRMTPVVCRNTMLVTGVAAVVAALIAGLWIPVVFGRDYQGSVAPYLWLLPGTVAFSGTKVLAAYVLSRGRPILNAWIAIGTFAVSVPATSLLTYSFGVPGAAAGTSLGYGVSLALSLAVYRALSGSPVREAVLPVRDDISIYTRAVANLWRRVRRKPSAALREPTGAD